MKSNPYEPPKNDGDADPEPVSEAVSPYRLLLSLAAFLGVLLVGELIGRGLLEEGSDWSLIVRAIAFVVAVWVGIASGLLGAKQR